jgi:hypothetical protein
MPPEGDNFGSEPPERLFISFLFRAFGGVFLNAHFDKKTHFR